MHRFHFNPKKVRDGVVELDGREAKHALSVLRLKVGDAAELFDGEGHAHRAVVSSADKRRISLALVGQKTPAHPRVEISLAAGVIKPDRMEWMLEKACELGARRWVPVLTERSVVKISAERWQAKVSRWRKIALESCKQCGQSRVPDVSEPISLKKITETFGDYDAVFIPTLAVSGRGLFAALDKRPAARKVLFLVGPEGDFTRKEVEEALASGAEPVSLGDLVMRAETAALFALSAACFYYQSQGFKGVLKE